MKVSRGAEPGTFLLRCEAWEPDVLERALREVLHCSCDCGEGSVGLNALQRGLLDEQHDGLRRAGMEQAT